MAGCFCGCLDQPVHRHHAITKEEIKRVHRTALREGRATRPLKVLLDDERNLVFAAHTCHGSHHAASQRYRLDMLPDSVYEFASELLGIRAHAWLTRYYRGEDVRLDALYEIAVPA